MNHVPRDGAAPVNSDYLYISRDACRTNHDCVFWIVINNIQILTGAEVNTEKNMPRSCVMLPEGRRPEGNIAQLRGIISQC